MENEEITTLILAGQGYELTVAPEAEKRKAELIATAATVTAVTSNDESGDAQRVTRSLAAMRIEIEKARKAVKEPVNWIAKLIDSTAKNFLAEIEQEEKRIAGLIGAHAEEVERERRRKEAEERAAFEEARKAREAAELSAAHAQESRKLSDIVAARKAEQERLAAAEACMAASDDLHATKVAAGVRFAIDFEVIDARMFAQVYPDLVEIVVKRADTIARIKEQAAVDATLDARISQPDGVTTAGIRIFKKPIVSSR